MRLLLILLAGFLPLAALAQADAEAPPCAWHSQPSTLRWGITSTPPGAWAGWWCPGADRFSPWRDAIAVVRFDLVAPKAIAAGGAAIQTNDQPALLALRDRSIYRPELAEVWLQGADEMRAAKPPGPAWVVASAGAATRPAYPITNGTRSTNSTGRATVGATCDCKVRSVEGASVYCAVNAERTLVALCRPL